MTSDTAPDMRAELNAERERIREQLEGLGHDGAHDSFDDGFADSGQVTAERGEVEALTQSLLEALDEVDRALAKLDDGTYGRCEGCGQRIADARLRAVPTARRCIECASATG